MKPTSVFVGGVGDDICREDLEREFSRYGNLSNIWIAQNLPGFAFIEYDDEDANEAIKEMNGAVINGSRIRVKISCNNGRRGGRGGGRGDRLGGGQGRGFSGGRDGGFRGCGGGGSPRQSKSFKSYVNNEKTVVSENSSKKSSQRESSVKQKSTSKSSKSIVSNNDGEGNEQDDDLDEEKPSCKDKRKKKMEKGKEKIHTEEESSFSLTKKASTTRTEKTTIDAEVEGKLLGYGSSHTMRKTTSTTTENSPETHDTEDDFQKDADSEKGTGLVNHQFQNLTGRIKCNMCKHRFGLDLEKMLEHIKSASHRCKILRMVESYPVGFTCGCKFETVTEEDMVMHVSTCDFCK